MIMFAFSGHISHDSVEKAREIAKNSSTVNECWIKVESMDEPFKMEVYESGFFMNSNDN